MTHEVNFTCKQLEIIVLAQALKYKSRLQENYLMFEEQIIEQVQRDYYDQELDVEEFSPLDIFHFTEYPEKLYEFQYDN